MAVGQQSTNRASSIFYSMEDLASAITAARTFGMRDLTVTTTYTAAMRGDSYVPERVAYHLDCRMIGDDQRPEAERQLAHIADARAAIETARGA